MVTGTSKIECDCAKGFSGTRCEVGTDLCFYEPTRCILVEDVYVLLLMSIEVSL